MDNLLQINHVRLRQAGGNANSARLAIERLLASADLRPPDLPPSATLFVRALRDPQPGRMAVGLKALRVRSEWEQRMRQHLADQLRHAARPARGPVSESAEAVLFADESEVLACLARDLLQGSVAHRWWWRSIISSSIGYTTARASVAEIMVSQLSQRPRLVPAVLAHLDRWGMARDLVHQFSPTQCERITQTMLEVHDLPRLSQVTPRRYPPQSPPWSESQVAIDLGRERSALLGLGLHLQTQPQVVRSERYQRRLHGWWQSVATKVTESSALASASTKNELLERGREPAAQNRSMHGPATEVLRTPAQSNARTHPDRSGQPTDAPMMPEQPPVEEPADIDPLPFQAHEMPTSATATMHAFQDGESADSSDAAYSTDERTIQPEVAQRSFTDSALTGEMETQQATPEQIQSQQTGPEQSGAQSAEEDSAASMLEPVVDSHDVRMPDETITSDVASSLADWLADGAPTQLGGVLYLINLMVALDLPDCFEVGWQLDSQVGAWGLLDALGRELLGAAMAEFQDDGLWIGLAHLDGRERGAPPGVRLGKKRPRQWPDFSLPPAWMAGIPAEGARGLSEQTVKPSLRRRIMASYPPLLARWLSLAMPFIEYRLRLALHVPDDANLADAMAYVPGRLYITSSHVDLVASLAAISLPVRMAGLDRDPGWQPGFGRVIYFHF